MQIILKFLIRNIWEKKFRTFLILISIILASALFFTSSAISGTFTQAYLKQMQVSVGNADIMIRPDDKSASSFMMTNRAEKYADELQYVIGAFYTSGLYKFDKNESTSITIAGFEYDDLQKVNPVHLDSEDNLLPFEGRKIILSKDFMAKHNLNLGDDIELKIEGLKRKFRICGKANSSGLFVDEGGNINAVVPIKTAASIYDVPQTANQIYVKLKDAGNTNQMIEELKNEYKGFLVERPISEEVIKRTVSQMSVPFMIMTVIVAMISLYIIFSSFRVITMERLPINGTLRSVGATRKTTDFIMILESMFYGILGGTLGIGLGIGLLNIIAVSMKPEWEKSNDVVVYFTSAHVVSTFVFAVVLCFASSIIPILRVSKIPVKDIVLNTIEKVKPRNKFTLFTGVLFVAAGVIVPPYTQRNISLYTDTVCTILSLTGIILLIPYIITLFVLILEKIYVLLFGNIGVLAAKNLRENKSIQGNISLMTIGIASLFTINVISSSFAVELIDFYNRAKFDIMLRTDQMDRNFVSILRTIDGVKNTYETYELNGIQVKGQSSRMSVLQGTDTMEFFEYWDIEMPKNAEAIINKLNTGRYIFITNVLKDIYNVGLGDKLTLVLNGNEREYEVAGFYDSMRNNGSYALISKRYLKLDTGLDSYTDVYIKTSGDPYEVKKLIQKHFTGIQMWIMTLDELAKMNKMDSEQFFSILTAFSSLALLIGIIGVVNNLIISFIHRRRSFAIFRSVGMEKRQIIMMLFIEAFTGGLIGGIIGVAGGVILTVNSGDIMLGVNLFIPMHFSSSLVITSILSGIILIMVASISPALKTSKLNIIGSIKYE